MVTFSYIFPFFAHHRVRDFLSVHRYTFDLEAFLSSNDVNYKIKVLEIERVDRTS